MIDTHIMSNFCIGCDKGPKSSDPSYDAWLSAHKPLCQKNYSGSAWRLEVEAAKVIFRRSVDQYNLKYTRVLCDGDAKTVTTLNNAKIYTDTIVKEDCGNHVSKRLYNGIEKAKQASKGTKHHLSGKGRITQKLQKQLSVSYGQALKDGAPLFMTQYRSTHNVLFMPQYRSTHNVLFMPQYRSTHNVLFMTQYRSTHNVLFMPQYRSTHNVLFMTQYRSTHNVLFMTQYRSIHNVLFMTQYRSTHNVLFMPQYRSTHNVLFMTQYRSTHNLLFMTRRVRVLHRFFIAWGGLSLGWWNRPVRRLLPQPRRLFGLIVRLSRLQRSQVFIIYY